MVDLKLVDSKSPMLFSSADYQLVVMPMITGESQKPKVEEKPVEASQAEADKAQAVAEAEAITKVKPKKKSKAKQPVAV